MPSLSTGIQSAKAQGADLLIVDTAGRLHNKKNLMDELNKMRRVIDREFPEADVRCMLGWTRRRVRTVWRRRARSRKSAKSAASS